MDNQKITPEQAAPILGISPNNIRHSMRNGTLPIGNVRPANTKTRGHRQSYRYDIYGESFQVMKWKPVSHSIRKKIFSIGESGRRAL